MALEEPAETRRHRRSGTGLRHRCCSADRRARHRRPPRHVMTSREIVMKTLLFACIIGLGLATPSFAQPAQAPADTNRPAASDMTGTNANMGKGAAHHQRSARAERRAGTGSTREQNAKEERETAQLNQQQLQQARQAR
ncbi:MAG: hypothetical protein ACREFL_17960 [Stellaceae bacterium]